MNQTWVIPSAVFVTAVVVQTTLHSPAKFWVIFGICWRYRNMLKISHALSTSRKHTTGFLVKSFRECCVCMVLTAACYCMAVKSLYSWSEICVLSVSEELNHDGSPLALNSDKGVCQGATVGGHLRHLSPPKIPKQQFWHLQKYSKIKDEIWCSNHLEKSYLNFFALVVNYLLKTFILSQAFWSKISKWLVFNHEYAGFVKTWEMFWHIGISKVFFILLFVYHSEFSEMQCVCTLWFMFCLSSVEENLHTLSKRH